MTILAEKTWLESLSEGSRVGVGHPARKDFAIIRLTFANPRNVGFRAPCGRLRLFSRVTGKELNRPADRQGCIFPPEGSKGCFRDGR